MPIIHDEEFGPVSIRRSRWSRALSLKVDVAGRVRISMPPRAPLYAARQLLEDVRGRVRQLLADLPPRPVHGGLKLEVLRKRARAYLPGRLAQLAAETGFAYQKIRLSSAGTRWGSCSSRGTLSLNIWLMELPAELIDYVIIHELCHTKQMNHSPAFWQLVEMHCPDFRRLRKQLRGHHPHG